MHEASIVAELIRLAGENAPAGGRIASLTARVGRLTGVSPEALQFYFEALRGGSACGAARLHVELVPLRGHCDCCGSELSLQAENVWSCPRCGAPLTDFENGDELQLVRLEVEDDGSDHARTEDPPEEHRHRR